MLCAFIGYSREIGTLDEELMRIRETEKWANGSHAMPLDRPLTGVLYNDLVIEDPDEAHYPNVAIWVLLGLGAGLVLGTLDKQSKK